VLAEMLVHRQQFALASDLLSRICAGTQREGRHAGEIRPLILLAIAHEGLGRHAEALVALRSTVAVGAPEKFVRVFLDAGPVIGYFSKRAEYSRSLTADKVDQIT